MNKKKLQREEIKQKISTLSSADCRDSDAAIASQVLGLEAFQKSSCIFCYISTAKEPDTRPILEAAWNAGKHVLVPKCVGRGQMKLFQIHSYEDLEPGSYGIPEPASHCQEAPPSAPDFAILPCLSCDQAGNRLGHGGGYYDRYLAQNHIPCAALCRDALLLEQVWTEPHDQPVTMVITETAIC